MLNAAIDKNARQIQYQLNEEPSKRDEGWEPQYILSLKEGGGGGY